MMMRRTRAVAIRYGCATLPNRLRKLIRPVPSIGLILANLSKRHGFQKWPINPEKCKIDVPNEESDQTEAKDVVYNSWTPRGLYLKMQKPDDRPPRSVQVLVDSCYCEHCKCYDEVNMKVLHEQVVLTHSRILLGYREEIFPSQ